MIRVQWLEARAKVARADEEYEIVVEEMARTLRFFDHMVEQWQVFAQKSQSKGRAAFSYKRAALFQRLFNATLTWCTQTEAKELIPTLPLFQVCPKFLHSLRELNSM